MKRRTSWKKYIILAGITGVCFLLPQKGYAADDNRSTIDIGNIDLRIFEIESLAGGYTLRSYKGEEKVVSVPDGIQVIGESAFLKNENLEEVVLPKSIKSIRDSAFSRCVDLKRIRWADDTEQNTEKKQTGELLKDESENSAQKQIIENLSEMEEGQEIGNDLVAAGCMPDLPTPQDIPDNVKCIGHYAFSGCVNLTEVVIPEGVEQIGWNAFGNCKSLRQIQLPENLKKIERRAFSGCESLEDINIPGSVSYIDEYTFEDCKSIRSFEIPETVQYCLEGVFKGCTSLERIVLPKQWKRLSGYAFMGCESLEEIDLPEQISSIGMSCFYNCRNLEEIRIPKALEEIGIEAFENTGWLNKKIKENPLVIVNDILLDGRTCAGKIAVPKVSKIGPGAFKGSGVTEVKIPEGVSSIGVGAFAGCEKLENIHLPESIKEIGNNVFEGCKSLTRIRIPEGVSSIGGGAFDGCENLRQVIIPTRVGIIGKAAFEDCKKLKDVIFLGNVGCMGRYYNTTGDVFRNCSKNLTIWAKRGSKMQSYAKYKKIAFREIPEKIKITFFKNGGRELSKKNTVVSFYKTYGKLPTVSRKGYQFDGWYTKKKGGDKITSASRVEEIRAHTLYAHWTKIRVKETELTGIKTISGKIKVKWKKVSGADGYELVWADNKKFRDAEKNQVGKTGYVIKKTKTGKKCYVKVRAYTLDSTGKKVYGRYSKVQRMTIPG